MKKPLLLLLLVFITAKAFPQDMLGIRSSNYAGLQGLGINPSSIVDSRLKLDINIASLGLTFENDFLFINKDDLKLFGFKKIFKNVDEKNYLEKFVKGELKGKNLTFGSTIMGPSVMFTINRKHTFAISSQVRSGISINGLLPQVAHYGYTELHDNSFTTNPKLFHATDFEYNAMGWQEYNLSYGTVLYNKERNFIKGATTLKYLAGIMAGYIRNPDIYFGLANDSTLLVGPSSFEYGRVNYNSFNGNFNDEDGTHFYNGTGFGWDLGFTYEYRKDPKSYQYEMDGAMRDNPELNKYIVRIGASVLDMGNINYKTNSRVFFINSQSDLHVYPDFTHDDYSSNLDFDSTISAIAYGNSILNTTTGEFSNPDIENAASRAESFKTSKKSFKMATPGAWSIQADWNVYHRFYLNASAVQGFKHKKQGVDRPSTLSLTPRYESEWLDVSIPFSVIDYEKSQTRLGFAFRLGSAFFGTDKLGTLLGMNDLYGMDVYAGLKVSLNNRRMKDRDNDRVSDRKDKCINVPGVWKFEGCPDKDGDGIQDKDDLCPDVPGLEQFKGCPDRDKDGIEDSKDECPDDAGLPEFNGCPDRDKDGIIDMRDTCPDLPGIAEFFGCPDRDGDKIIDPKDECPDKAGLAEFNGCPDSDSDGIPDPKDQCPFEVGPQSNKGCPIKVAKVEPRAPEPVKVELTKEEEEVINTVFKNLQFETGKAIIKPVSFPSLDALAELMKRKATFKLLIEGHTDNVGAAKMNLTLSDKRAKAAKDYLVSKGAAETNITSKGYGMTKPVAPNTTAEGRQQNRRVEFTIVK